MDPTPGAYVTPAEATTYLQGRPNSEAWEKASDDQKAGALLEASDVIDSYPWQGLPLTEDQGRAWPRKLVDVGSIRVVQRAVILEALALLEGETDASSKQRAALQRQGVTSFSNGPLSESYGGAQALADGLRSRSALHILRPYLVTSGAVR